jgi:hypothetical protein
MHIPYSWLSKHPQRLLLCEGVPVYFRLATPGGSNCLISLEDSHTFESGRSLSVPVGTRFELEYKGIVDEIHLGRWLLVCDA